jgi:putative ABC transport system substrate-binding protein
MDHWSRRQFVQGVSVAGLGLLAGCGRLLGQAAPPAPRVPRVGVLSSSSASSPSGAEYVAAFRQGLDALGRVEGQNIAIEWRFADGQPERLPELAAELVALPVDALVAGGDGPARAAKGATDTTPVIMALSTDPVGTGLIASLARPGGNVTGLSNLLPDLAGKRLELLKTAVPSISRVAALGWRGPEYQAMEAAAAELGVQIQLWEVFNVDDIHRAFEATTADAVEGLVVLATAVTVPYQELTARLAAARHLPAVSEHRAFAQAGGFMAYGPDIAAMWRRSAYYLDKVLNGTNPADLPVEQAMRFDFVINLKAAQALGLTIPQHVLLQATEVLQ